MRGTGVALLTGLVLAASAGAAPLPRTSPLYSAGGEPIVNENPDVSAVYKGTIVENFSLPAHGSFPEHITRKAQLEWEESVTGPVDEIEYTGIYGAKSIHWKLTKLTGEIKEEGVDNYGHAFGCSGTFSPSSSDGGEGGVFVPLESPGHPASGGNPATNPDYSVRPPAGMPVYRLQSSGPKGSECETEFWNGTGTTTWGSTVAFSPSALVKTDWGDTVGPTAYFPVGGEHTLSLPFEYVCAPPECGTGSQGSEKFGSTSVKVESSIVFRSPGGRPSSSKGPTAGKSRPAPGGNSPSGCSKEICKADKKAARLAAAYDMRAQLDPLALQCGIAAVGTSLLVAGVMASETGGGAVVAVAGPAGAEILTGAGTACVVLIKRIYDDAKTIEDPPSRAFRKLARPSTRGGPAANLPSCPVTPTEAARVCAGIRSAELRYLATLRGGQAVAAALLMTTDRISGAVLADDASAAKMQTSYARGLATRLRAGVASERTAGRALAALISGAKLTLRLSSGQAQAGITRAFAGLAKLGSSGARAQSLAGVRLSAAPTEGLGVLSR